MEKIKNILKPGSKLDDEVMYGSGQIDDPVLTGNKNQVTGQGSHFGDARDPHSSSTNPAGRAMPGSFDDEVATTASIKSGVPGSSQSGNPVGGAQDFNTNKPLPNQPSATQSGLTGSGRDTTTGSGSGYGGNTSGVGSGLTSDNTTGSGSELTGNSGYGNQTTGSSHLGRDAALGAGAVGAGEAAHHHHKHQDRDAGRYDDKNLTGTGYNDKNLTGTGVGQSRDPAYTNQPSGSSHLGRDAALGAGAVGAGEAAHHHKHHERDAERYENPTGTRSGQMGYGQTGTSGYGNEPTGTSHLGRDAALGAGAVGVGEATHHHKHHDTHTGRSDNKNPTGTGFGPTGTSGYGNEPTGTSHLGRDAALGAGAVGIGEAAHHHNKNRHEDSGRSFPLGGSSNEPTGSSHLGRDAALGAGAVGIGEAAHHHNQNRHEDSGRSFPLGGNSDTNTGSYAPGQTGTYQAGAPVIGSSTKDPYSSTAGNTADPQTRSGFDNSRNAGSTGYGSNTTGIGSGTGPTDDSSRHGHLGRDAAIGAGTGLAASHEHNKHGHQYTGDPCESGETGPSGVSFTHGPHVTDTANRLDPHVASGITAPGSTTGPSGTTGTTDTKGSSGGHHLGRDAALAGGVGAGAAGIGEHAGQTNPTSSSTGPAPNTAGPHKQDVLNKLDPRVDSDQSKQRGTTGTGLGDSTTGTSDPYSSSSTGRDHHYGRDAGLATAGGVGAYEADKHLGGHRDTAPQDRLAGSGHQPATGTSGITAPQDRLAGSGYPANTTTGTDSYRDNRGVPENSHHGHHTGRDVAAGVGAGAVGEHELSKHDQKKEEKVLAKEEKREAKEEKKEEKALAKEEKREAKEEKHEEGGKKHGGILGFLHRDKNKHKDEKDQTLQSNRSGDEEMAAGVGAIDLNDGTPRPEKLNDPSTTYDPLAHEHGSQSGVHDTPIGQGNTTHDAYGTSEGHNKLHKDPPPGYLQ